MYGTEVYDKVYFRDDYQKQFEAFRSRYHGRVQQALAGRAVDSSPTPNATTYIALHELEDGGVTVASSGDFLEYFNRRYGGRDRIGACRAALATALQKREKQSSRSPRERADAVEGGALACRMRFSRSHLVLVNVMFTLLLVLSLVLLGASGVMLRHSEEALARAEAEALYVNAASTDTMLTDTASPTVNGDYLAYSQENTVTAYEVEEQSFWRSLQKAFSYLW